LGHIPFVIYRHVLRGQLGIPLSSLNVTVLPTLEIWRAINISPRLVFAFAPTTSNTDFLFCFVLYHRAVKLHQQGHIHSLYGQMFPVVLKLDATDNGHLSGFVNFHGGKRPEGFPVGKKFSIITDNPNAGIIQEFLHLTVQFVHPSTAQVHGYIDGSDAEFQPVNTVANVLGELDEHYAKMAIEIAKKSTPEDDKPHPKVGAVAVKHGQLLGVDCRTAVETNGKKSGQHAEFRLTSALGGGALDGATIYTTLEPCLDRNDPKVSCVDRLISVKVARVVIGALDPDPKGNGLRKLVHSPTIEVALFPAALRADARELIREWKEYREKQQQLIFAGAYAKFEYEFLTQLHKYPNQFMQEPHQLSVKYGISVEHIEQFFIGWAQQGFVSLTAWDNSIKHERPWNEWPAPKGVFFTPSDKSAVRIRILAPGSKHLETLTNPSKS
jgi:pyrimidine deaminase RibD-like protein